MRTRQRDALHLMVRTVLVSLRLKESLHPALAGASLKSGVSNSESTSLGVQRRCLI